MSNVLAQAQIILTADTARFTQEINSARNLSVNSFDDIQRSAKEMAKVGMMGVVAGATAATTAIATWTVEQVKLANELSKTALVANTSVTAIQKYTFAAKAAGIEQDKLGDIFRDTQDKIGDFLSTGGGELQDFFKNVAPQAHLTADALRRMSGPEALQAMYDAMDKANLSQSEMVFYMEGIADEASSLIPLLADGGAGFKLWADAAENAGAVMDEKTIRASQELKASTDLLNLSYQGVKNQLTQALIPVLGDLAGDLVKDANLKNQAKAAGDGLAVGLKFIAKSGLGTVATFDMMGTALGGLLAMIGQLGNGVDWNSPYAFFQMGQNFLSNNRASAQIGANVLDDLSKKIDTYASKMEYFDKLGTNGTNQTVAAYVKLNNAIDQNNTKLGKTGAQIQEQLKKEEELAKAREKNAKDFAKANAMVSNTALNGLKIKSSEATAGGKIRQATADFAQLSQSLLGDDMKYFSAFNDRYHLGRNSDHNRGMAFDIVMKNAKDARAAVNELNQAAKQYGYTIKIIDEYANPSKHATGGHIHVSVKGYRNGKDGSADVDYIKQQNQQSLQAIKSQAAESQRIAEQQARDAERAIKEQLDLQARLKAEYADEETKRTIEHQNKLNEIAKVNNAQLQKDLIAQENARYQNANAKAQLEYDVKIQQANEWQQTDEERIRVTAGLERREIGLTVGLHKDLIAKRIDEINAKEQAALRQTRQAFQDELASVTGYKVSEIDKIRNEWDAKIAANDRRTDISPEQISTLREAMTGAKIDAIRVSRQPSADSFNGLNAEMSGTTGFYQLSQQHEQRLQIIKDALDKEVIAKEQGYQAMAIIDQNYANQQRAILAGGYQQTFGVMASLIGKFGGEQSKAFHVLANIEKGYAVYKAFLNNKTAILDAYANTPGSWVQKAIAAGKVAIDTGVMTAAIEAINPKGFATGGYTGDIPVNAVAGWVHGGEYVFDAEATRKIGTKNLDSLRKGDSIGGNTNINVNVTVNSDGNSSVESQQQFGKNLGDVISAAVQKELIKQKRQGGMLSGVR